ncbi:hypothetical protein F7Q99_20280 [Streptomyces kaniharaensis]|uniref:Uncharacterized protein n=1 Tax=Streptomyces kaniharaensis TaxID=212423 RepID=A0A6N7KW45_9ACTN|nr:hypothetical protein [Streptomyces kaniharaensis]MQS14537.1 hypothetical protein [Streptomyces kaniharaensis]
MSVVGGTPSESTYTTMGHCPRCYAYTRGRLLRTVDERRELIQHDDCPGSPPTEVRACTYNG